MANELDLSDSAPTAGGDDWNIRLSYLNRAQFDLQEAYDWRWAQKIVNTRTSQATGNVTVTLPSDFRKLASSPRITWDGVTTENFTEVNLVDTNRYLDTDRYIYVQGNPADNYSFVINGATLASGASINYTYYAALASLASPANVSMAPDPTFLVQRALYYYLKSRGDERFQEAKVTADQILQRLLEKENTRGDQFDDRIKLRTEGRMNFRIGRDG